MLAAAALRCVGGQLQTRLVFRNDGERRRAERFGIRDLHPKYLLKDLASGDVVFAATGVTDGTMLEGVKDRRPLHDDAFHRDAFGHATVRWIKMRHPHNAG